MRKLSFKKIKRQAPLMAIFLVFGFIYCAISLVNHYLFRTEALDLGMFNHAVYHFSRFEKAIFSLSTSGEVTNYFADHFAPITFLLAPLRFVFGSYALLVAQIAAVLFGGYGIFKLAIQAGIKYWLALVILFQFFSLWGIYSAISFDFHTNVLAAMFVPWLIYFYRDKNKPWFLLFYVLILITKENMAMWMIFIMIGLMIRKNPDWKGYLRFEIPLTIFAIIYTAVVIGWAMPELSGFGENIQMMWYAHLGDGFTEKITTILYNPFQTIDQFFDQSLKPDAPTGIKNEFHLVMLLSGGFLLLFKPQYLFMLLPIYAQKFLSSNILQWSILSHYSIEFVPMLSLATIAVAGTKFKATPYLIVAVAVSTVLTTLNKLNANSIPWYDSKNVNIFSPEHYVAGIDRDEILESMAYIPDHASLSVSSCLAPHLALRDSIFLFPNINEADFVMLVHKGRPLYPASRDQFNGVVDDLTMYEETSDYDLIYYSPQTILLKRSEYLKVLPPPRLKYNSRVEFYKNQIKSDPEWVEAVRKKSIIDGISLDSMISVDAIYLADEEEREQQLQKQLKAPQGSQ